MGERSRNSDLGGERSRNSYLGGLFRPKPRSRPRSDRSRGAGLAFSSTRAGSSATLSLLSLQQPSPAAGHRPVPLLTQTCQRRSPLGNLAAFAHFSAQKRAEANGDKLSGLEFARFSGQKTESIRARRTSGARFRPKTSEVGGPGTTFNV